MTSEIIFMVVEFLEEETVAVVPKTWVEDTKEGFYSFWPPTHASSRVKKGELPDPKWPKYSVRIFSETDNYFKAQSKANRAMESSNVDSLYSESDDEQNNIKRKRVVLPKAPEYKSTPQISQLQSSPELTRIDSNEQNNIKRKRVVLPKAPEYQSTPKSQISEMDANQSTPKSKRTDCVSLTPETDANKSTPQISQLQSSPELTRIDSTPSRSSSENFQLNLLMKIETIREMVQDTNQMVRNLYASKVPDSNFEGLEKPCESMQQLQELCAKVEEDDSFKRNIIVFLSTMGGHNVADTVRRIMRSVATNMVLSLFSMKGRKGKNPFQNLIICKIIIKACRRLHTMCTIKEIEDLIGDTLKYAPHRSKKNQTVTLPDVEIDLL